MGSLDGCGKCGNTALTFGYFVHDETGEVIPEISCIKCGWRFTPPPKCTEPTFTEAPYPRNPKQAAHRPRKRYGTCVNCGRENLTLSHDKCWWCNTHGYSKEEARMMAANDMIRPGVGMWHHHKAKSGKAKPRKANALSEVRV